MGPEIIVFSGFSNNRGQKSADLVISEPRNITALPTSQSWDDLTSGYYLVQSITCHHCPLSTWYDTCLLYTSPSSHRKEWQTHLLQHTALVVCETERRPHTNATAAAPPPSKPPQQQHHHHSTHSSRGGGDLAPPSTQYTWQILKNKGRRKNKTYQIQNRNTFQKSEAV